MFARSILFLLILPLLMSICMGAARAEESTKSSSDKVVIILDASGSMWGQVEARPKIDIAKSVVKDLLTEWDDSIELGLTAYGHRRKADCKDIESLVPPGKLEKQSSMRSHLWAKLL